MNGPFVMKINSRGQVTIPKEIREALRLLRGDNIMLRLVGDEVRLRGLRAAIEAGYGAVKPISRPEDFRKLRREVEEEMAEEAAQEG